MKTKQILPHLLISLTLSIRVRKQGWPITDISETRNETFSVTYSFLHSATQDFQNLYPSHHVDVASSGPYHQECTESFSSKCVFFLMCSASILLYHLQILGCWQLCDLNPYVVILSLSFSTYSGTYHQTESVTSQCNRN